jgi:hypothetical protein
MEQNQLATQTDAQIIEGVLLNGDLGKLSPEQRVTYYRRVCASLNLNPFTKPFDYINLNGKLTLYAKKDCTDQIRNNNGVSITKLEREKIDEIYTVTAYAQDKTGRTDSSIGAVSVKGLQGDAMANAIMKAETKAKRRVTLSICGLGIMDETEVETTPAVRVVVTETGEIVPPNGKQSTAMPREEIPATGHAPEPAPAETGEKPELVYADPVAKFGTHKYPAEWTKALMVNLHKTLGGNAFEVDGILQKLRLPPETTPDDVLAEIQAYLLAK